MANEIDVSKRQELLTKARADLSKIENAEKTSERQAIEFVRILVNSYPQAKANCPDVYLRQIRDLLKGRPLDATMALVDPNRGIVMQCTFLPTIAELFKWLEDFQATSRAVARQLFNEIKTLEPPDEPPAPTADERARRVEAAQKFMKPKKPALSELEWLKPPEQRSAQERKMEERFKRTQRSVPELAMEALKNLENSRGGG